jgi:hypothetical protein
MDYQSSDLMTPAGDNDLQGSKVTLTELNELQLAIVGGGIGDFIPG